MGLPTVLGQACTASSKDEGQAGWGAAAEALAGSRTAFSCQEACGPRGAVSSVSSHGASADRPTVRLTILLSCGKTGTLQPAPAPPPPKATPLSCQPPSAIQWSAPGGGSCTSRRPLGWASERSLSRLPRSPHRPTGECHAVPLGSSWAPPFRKAE